MKIDTKEKKKKLLVVTPYYPSKEKPFEGVFVEQQLELIKHEFKKLIVFRYHSLKFRSKNSIPKLSYKHNNIDVINLLYFDNNHISKLFGDRMKSLKFQILLNYYLRFLFVIKFDIVLSQWILPSTYVFSFLARRKKITSVVRGMDITILKKQFPTYFIKAIKKSSSIITNGSYAIELIRQFDENVLIENVYNPKNLKPFLDNGFVKTDRVKLEYTFTSVGRFDLNKRQDLLLQLVQRLKAENIKVVLYLIGSGKGKASIVKTSNDLGINDDVVIKSDLTHFEIAEIFSNTDFYLQPSMREGVPNALVEAMASGCCCIARNVGGIPDLIEHNRTGFLFEKDEDLFNLVKNLFNKNNDIIKIQAKEKVIGMFDNDVNISKLLKQLK